MKIALIGFTGNVGTRVVAEALTRGHEVTGISRHPENAAAKPGLTPTRGDAGDPAALAPLLAGHDAVVSSTRFQGADPRNLIGAVRKSGVKRLIVVGGAGSLEVAPGVALVDTAEFPAAYKPEALAGRDFLNALRAEAALNWTFFSPAAFFGPGPRTGKFRLGGDRLIVGADGQSRLSMEDYAIALLDELESPKHPRGRFTAGY
ncbi:MAG: NAD(P)-dependent oxidoreductase [Elusimicrobiota bacterium]